MKKFRYLLIVLLRPDPEALTLQWAYDNGGQVKRFRIRVAAEDPIAARRRVIELAQKRGAIVSQILGVTEIGYVE